jgi:hypothetical protein
MILGAEKLEDRYVYVTNFSQRSLLGERSLPEKIKELIRDIENYFKINLEDKGQKENTYLFSHDASNISIHVLEHI